MKSLFMGLLMVGLAAASFGGVVALSGNQGASIVELTDSQTVAVADVEDAVFEAASNGDTDKQKIEEAINNALPFGLNIGGDFDLIDHFGQPKRLADYAGSHVLLFFGYANCEAICSQALPLMADAITNLGDDAGKKVVPLMITVDPENDTPDFMKKRLGEYHPALIGMTGSDGALADVRQKFRIKIENVGHDINGNPIYNHGSFIYLLGPDGKFQTLLPPILEAKQMAEIIKSYVDGTAS